MCKHLEIAPTQKVLALKAPAHLHLPLALLSLAHKDWTLQVPCHLKVQTWHMGLPQTPARAQHIKCKHLEITPTQKVLALKALAHPLLPVALLSHVQKDSVFVLALPPQSSDVLGVIPRTPAGVQCKKWKFLEIAPM